MKGSVFHETQRFRQTWSYLIYLLLGGFFLLFIYAIVQQVFMGKPFGEKPAPDLVLVFCALFMLVFLWFIYSLKLETAISADSVKFKFSPFHWKYKEISWQSVNSAAIIDYGFIGYGIRFIAGGRAYNVGGKKGLLIVLDSGRKILIGTQQPQELTEFLQKAGRLA